MAIPVELPAPFHTLIGRPAMIGTSLCLCGDCGEWTARDKLLPVEDLAERIEGAGCEAWEPVGECPAPANDPDSLIEHCGALVYEVETVVHADLLAIQRQAFEALMTKAKRPAFIRRQALTKMAHTVARWENRVNAAEAAQLRTEIATNEKGNEHHEKA